MRRRLSFLILIFALKLFAQEKADSSAVMKQILDRLDSLEKQNRDLLQEVHALRQQVEAAHPAEASSPGASVAKQSPPAPGAAGQAGLGERVSVEESRTAEQAQTKVEAAHKFPIQLDGMLLFNAFSNTGNYAEYAASNEYGPLTGPNTAGATFRQTLLGLQFQGPSLPGDGHINGSLMMDFWGGSSDPQSHWLRLRHADISLDWKNRSLSFRQDKPLISPYQPDSLAEVGIPPLSGAGNLWLWLPQVRYEERLHFDASTGLTGQVALLETRETSALLPSSYLNSLEPSRPALEGRFAFWHKFDDTRRVEVAPGFHLSTSHVAGASVDSHIASLDWQIIPASHLQFSGTVFEGQNVAGLGSLGNGFTIAANGVVRPVKSSGGWAQVAIPITNRLTFNVYSGLESDNGANIYAPYIVRNLSYASNVMYHLGPNVIVSVEGMQSRLRSFSGTEQTLNHYDLAVGYLF
ncbi:MAG: hypothetical protein WB676_23820 [Bryobacteraceae bacterium]